MLTHFTRFMALGAPILQRSAAPATSTSTAASSTYSLVADYTGTDFFDGFTTYTGADPTDGNVNYTDMAYAAEKGYVGFIERGNATTAYIGVDYQNVQVNRNSVRLLSKQTFEVGMLAVFDIIHAPVAYGSWPAWWFDGDIPGGTWPGTNGGELDVVEWVHESTYNSMTLHTGPDCAVENATATFQGELQNTNCNAGEGSDGCSIQSLKQDNLTTTTIATAGKAFNAQGGGIYVAHWETSGVTVWMFGRDSIPSDLTSGNPDPSSWTQEPLAQFSGTGCDYSSSLSTLQLIQDQTFCGSWAGTAESWESSGAAKATNTSTCAAYVENNPAAFKDAYFEMNGVQVYSCNTEKPGTATTATTATKRDLAAAVDFPSIDLAKRYQPASNSTAMIAKHFGDRGVGHGHHGQFNGTYYSLNGTANSTQPQGLPPIPTSTSVMNHGHRPGTLNGTHHQVRLNGTGNSTRPPMPTSSADIPGPKLDVEGLKAAVQSAR